MLYFRELCPGEITRELFCSFQRRQIVTDCWRNEAGRWVVRKDPFVDDWGEDEYHLLVRCLKNTCACGGFVYGAFLNNQLKGFVSVEWPPIGSKGQYLDLSSLHVSCDARRHGIGRRLFEAAAAFARSRNIPGLYISAHSAVESQAFYRAMGCTEAVEYQSAHVEKEPFDCQLEYRLPV